ncbi:MAG: periplasmic nitrate reductase, NapE protein [Shewanella sp.]
MGASTAVDKSLELKIFIFLTVFLAPLLAILLVSGIGFAVWFSQMLIGPPGVS